MAEHKSLWSAITASTSFPRLKGDKKVDVVIVGAGISGLTAAFRLSRAGKKVAVVERKRVGGGETGSTTAHLTQAIDTRYPTLKNDFGLEGARLVAESHAEAIHFIEHTVHELGASAHFERLPGYLYSEFADGMDKLREELKAAKQSGLDVSWVERAPLPFANFGAVRYGNQAQVQPLGYLRALAEAVVRAGGQIFENSMVNEISEGSPGAVATEQGSIEGKELFVAAHSPICNRFFLQTKLAAYRTYVIAFEPREEKWLGGLFWDLDDPYHYTRCERTDDGKILYIVGGEDHKTGENTFTDVCFRRLEHYAEARYGIKKLRYTWSGQILEPVDGLPYIGKNALSRHEYVATGYTGNGMTFGTIAGLLVSDLILERSNPWESLYKATRVKPLSSAVDYIAENVDFPRYLIEDRLKRPSTNSVDDVLPGEGKLLKMNGKTIAAYRDAQGALTMLSPVCPHLGCRVHFNSAEKSWDCPCHGSRFNTKGEVLNGPALRGLAPVQEKEKVPGAA